MVDGPGSHRCPELFVDTPANREAARERGWTTEPIGPDLTVQVAQGRPGRACRSPAGGHAHPTVGLSV